MAFVALLGTLVALPLPVYACAVGFKPQTEGFVLNPILRKLTVTSSKPEKAGDACVLHVGDEILQVNSQSVPGSRALAVMRYWKAVPGGSVITFVVRRDGAIVKVTTR